MSEQPEKQAPSKKPILIGAAIALAIAAAFLAGRVSGPPEQAPAAFAPQAAPAPAAPAFAPQASPAAPVAAPEGPRGPTKQEMAKGMRTYALAMIETIAYGLSFAPNSEAGRKILASPKVAEGFLMLEAARLECEASDEACKAQAREKAKAVHEEILAAPNPAEALQRALQPYKADTYMQTP